MRLLFYIKMLNFVNFLVVSLCAGVLVSGQDVVETDAVVHDVLNDSDPGLMEKVIQELAQCIIRKIKDGLTILGFHISLDPFELPILPLSMNNDLLRGFMLFTKFRFEGLSDFTLKGDFQIGHTITLGIKHNKFQFSTKYKGRMETFNMFEIYGAGSVNFELIDANVDIVVKTNFLPPLQINHIGFDLVFPKISANITGLFDNEHMSGLVTEQLVDTLNTLGEEEQSRVGTFLSRLAITFAKAIINPILNKIQISDIIKIIETVAKMCQPDLEYVFENLLKFIDVAGIDLHRVLSDYSKYQDTN